MTTWFFLVVPRNKTVVAKGNDGNYFQHSIEVAIAVQLAAMSPDRRLHVALAHGMAPFEACDEPKRGQSRALLEATLNDSRRPRRIDEPPIVSAYRDTDATLRHYPNSAELLRVLIGAKRLSGGITEVDSEKHAQLRGAWAGSKVAVAQASWRNEVGAGGVLSCPASLVSPWLFTLDPMTYREDDYSGDNNVYRADLEPLSDVLTRFVCSGKPGVMALFVYSIKPKDRARFWGFAEDLANRTKTSVVCCWHTHQGGNRNLAGLFCSGVQLQSAFPPVGITVGRE
jgi:hypothetical protein